MKSLDAVLQGYKSEALDGRDSRRLADFVPEERLSEVGLSLEPEYIGTHKHKEWTRENILSQLKEDVAFGFQKALDQRGISSSLMFSVVRMWNSILEDGLEEWSEDNYAQYGLPLFKATAVKYGFDNPIGKDVGDEYKYSA